MGFFNRNQKREQPVELECAIIERSPVEVGELEQMVRVTFEEKQELAVQLEEAESRINSLKELYPKLRAAEEYSRQIKKEAENNERAAERAKTAQAVAESNLKEERAKVAALTLKIQKLEAGESERVRIIQHEFTEAVKRQVDAEKGGWSKQRVLEFIDSFSFDPSESDV